MRGVDSDEDLLPVRVVESAPDEDAVPLVQDARVEIELASGQLEHVVGRALAHRQKDVRQSRPETETDVVTFVTARVDSN